MKESLLENQIENLFENKKENLKPKTEKEKSKIKKVQAKEKTKKTKAVKVVKKEIENTLVEEVISKREVKYIYPEDCQDTLSRKKWRQQVRNKLHSLELEMLRIEDKASKEFLRKEKEYKAFKSKNLKAGAA